MPNLLQIIGVAPADAHGLKKKCKFLAGLMDKLEPAWLVSPMVEAALKADIKRLDLATAQEAELTAPVTARLASMERVKQPSARTCLPRTESSFGAAT